MKLLVTADLHYGQNSETDAATRVQADQICTEGGDILLVLGDLATRDPVKLGECMQLFADFPGKRLFLAGNHDLWSPPFKPMIRYERLLAKIGDEFGFHYLDNNPYISGSTAFVGNIGWYDYSFADDNLDIDHSLYQDKLWPGIASWNDRNWIKWNLSDKDFTELCLRKLQEHLDSLPETVDNVIGCMHHLPFEELVIRRPDSDRWAFCNAFLGSSRFGEIFAADSRVSLVLCGHLHSRMDVQIGGIRAVSNGSRNNVKVYDEYEI